MPDDTLFEFEQDMSRADVATFVLDCIEEDTFVHELPRIVPR